MLHLTVGFLSALKMPSASVVASALMLSSASGMASALVLLSCLVL